MRILAIDPGTTKSAWVIWDGEKIWGKGISPNEKYWFDKNNYDHRWEHVVIEEIASYGMPVGKTVFETCIWVGRFIEKFAPIPVSLLLRLDVKKHLCNTGRNVKDAHVRQALVDRFGPPGTKKTPGVTYGLHDDLWAAFAVAVTWWDLNQPKC